MDWSQIEGKWDQLKDRIKAKWDKLSDDDISSVRGRRDDLVGRISDRYSLNRDDATKQVDEFGTSLRDEDFH